jgi:Concanavalin A-like lectin/glucanases superfamily
MFPLAPYGPYGISIRDSLPDQVLYGLPTGKNISDNVITYGNSGAPQATQFDGVNDFAEVTGLGLGAPNEFTAMGWIRPSTIAGNPYFFDTCASIDTNGYLIIRSGAQLRYASSGPGTGISAINANVGLVAGRAYHVALIASGGFIFLYLDGALANTTSVPITNRPSSLTRLRFGSSVNSANFFSGNLAAWSVYTRALSEEEIRQAASAVQLYPNANLIVGMYTFDRLAPLATNSPDFSGLGRNLTLTNMPANPITTF